MKNFMTKRMIIMLISVGILFGLIFLYKAFVALMIKHHFASNKSPVITVSAKKVDYSWWQPKIVSSGSLRAVKGVNVTTELAGLVQNIFFTPGTYVKQGTVLVQLNADAENAAVRALKASVELATITYERDKAQYEVDAVSKQTVDNDRGNLHNLEGQLAQQMATAAKKTIRAPFTGRLGVSAINPGQFVNAGDKVVSLQTLNPIWCDFFVPQQITPKLKAGFSAIIYSDVFPTRTFIGKITTIEPAIDASTRNTQVEATIFNNDFALTPGMYVTVEVTTGAPERLLTLPQTAITFNAYGETVFVITQKGTDKKGKPVLIATQKFVKTGETRGDQVTILEGLKKDDLIVTSGGLKLKSGYQVVINNSIVPANNATPASPNEY